MAMTASDPYRQSYLSRTLETAGFLTKVFGIAPIAYGAYRAWLVGQQPASVFNESSAVTVLLHGVGGAAAAYACLLLLAFIVAGSTYLDDRLLRRSEERADVGKLLMRTHGAFRTKWRCDCSASCHRQG